jgi:hypothetical protein
MALLVDAEQGFYRIVMLLLYFFEDLVVGITP